MIVIFLVDTSASMNQKFSSGMSALECTKSGIEHLVKHLPQVKSAEKHNDKFMLVTYGDGAGCIKSSLKDPLPHLIKELKVLKANDVSNPGSSLSTIFDLLNVYRVYHGIDTPASGRFPGTIEPSIILWFTDGGKQTSTAGTLDRLNIPGIATAGADYYHEPFRWDQRLYTIFLEPNAEVVDPQLSILSTVMGGSSYRVRTLRHMLQAMDCMLGMSKIPPTQYSPQAVLHIYGIVANFEDLIVDPRRPNTANHHQLVYVNPSWLNPQSRHPGFFPIPEPFWPEVDGPRLPARNAQPTMHYHTKEEKSIDIPEGFPYDKYVVAPCPMTQELLTRPPGTCWPVYVKNSYKTDGFGFPFVNLNSIPSRTPTAEWLRDFAEYLSHTPSYYYVPLRNALKRIGLFNIIPPDQGAMSQGTLKIISRNKMQASFAAKAELDRFLASESGAIVDVAGSKKRPLCVNAFDVPRSELIAVLDDMKRSFFKDLQITNLSSTLPNFLDTSSTQSVPKSTLEALSGADLRLDSIMDPDELHSLPIADMGIYQDRMQKIQQENLRDPFRDEESAKSMQRTMFGNPYKQDKKVSIDEEDEASAAGRSVSSNSSASGSSWSSILGRRRKPRRRSISPSPFPIEKIPSLARTNLSTPSKVQVVAFGESGGKSALPLLNILVQHGSERVEPIATPTESIGRHMVMHDGEDEDEEEDDFRRAMFNSDEMELDGEDEAARLRADTPMPGGIGLDDDDEEMDDLQHAQDMIPPPVVPISIDDIATSSGSPYSDGATAVGITLGDEEYSKHHPRIHEDLEQFHGTAKPVFESLVYDPTALMELQSIPRRIPERSALASSEAESTEPASLTMRPQDTGDPTGISNTTDSLHEMTSDFNGLTPVPILFPPLSDTNSMVTHSFGALPSTATESALPSDVNSVSSGTLLSLEREANHKASNEEEALKPGEAVTLNSTALPGAVLEHTLQSRLQSPSTAISHDVQSIVTEQPEPGQGIQQQPLEIRKKIVRQLKLGPVDYDEASIINMLWQVNETPNWSKQQKRALVLGCLHLAKGLRRTGVVSVMEAVVRNTTFQ
ncbi:Integrator complex subunit 6 [Mortierella claussenii]|nr:Integrator complex subunit 6 [Mortierella claussenii]